MLDAAVRADLRSLAPETSESVALQLVAAGLLVDDEPVKALVHARAARSIAARVGAVREAVGVAAYHAQEWTEALAELRAARRISGDPRWLAVMADCERALGRPERALKALDDPDLRRLDAATQVEVLIVVAGARRDMGQLDAALQLLERGGLNQDKPQPGSARLWYTYADTLSQLGREDEAREWFGVVAAMPDDETDAAERAGIDQVDFEYAEGFEELDHDADEQSSSDA
jgi:tetratricopeptide (TPR) repeat protein